METKELTELADLLERVMYMKEDINKIYSQDVYSRDYLYGMFETIALIRRYAEPDSALRMMEEGK